MAQNESPGVTLEQISGPAGNSPEEGSQLSFTPDKDFGGAVSQAIALKSRIARDSLELERLKGIIRDGARKRLPAGKRRNPTNESIEMVGVCGGIATVTFPGPKSIAAFWFQRDKLAWRYKNDRVICLGDIRKFSGKCFETLFMEQRKPTKNFAHVVGNLVAQKQLSKSDGKALIEMCLEESTPRVDLEDLS